MDFLKDYNINIKNDKLLDIALTHSSYSNENDSDNYERLEFLGDAVLQLIVSEYLYNTTDFREGKMSKERAAYVCEEALAGYAKTLGIDKHIRVGNGIKGTISDSIIADVFESVLAVIYLESGLEVCKEYLLKYVIPYIEKGIDFFKDYKTALQELVQTDRKSLNYILVEEFGLQHDKTFKVNVLVDDIVLGTGLGKTKKEAEQNAAKQALEKCAR